SRHRRRARADEHRSTRGTPCEQCRSSISTLLRSSTPDPRQRRSRVLAQRSGGLSCGMIRVIRALRLASLALVLPVLADAGFSPPITIEIADYAALPVTGTLDGTGQTDGMLARVNSLHEEPGGASRLFVNDLNGPLY